MSEKRSKHLRAFDKATGPCPYCKKKEHWYNGVPLRAFCWGTEKKPHREWRKLIPGKLQPYNFVGGLLIKNDSW
jgi:hypothetical protein